MSKVEEFSLRAGMKKCPTLFIDVLCQPIPDGILDGIPEKQTNKKAQPNQQVELGMWRRDRDSNPGWHCCHN
ncbi:hypothetical protein AERO8C_20496 [Aeromonas veronii]|uniref:Uncharacterized protein n=1 Tax=Aeromonas veronii TaxID=654 RepID=A0A653L1Y5_AERVE|nr:hypothetical protein AERO8C_20496 [Aeromonas veronii]